jgi:hypothetical protein
MAAPQNQGLQTGPPCAKWPRQTERFCYKDRKMAEHSEEEGPIHQARWVFYLTVGVCYAALGLVMFGKWSGERASLDEIGYLFTVQAGVIASFLVLFGVIFYVANKLIGATDQK